MKKRSYIKNQFRNILNTKARFLSIFLIVFLGASFYGGLRQTPDVMRTSVNTFLSKHNFQDVEMISTYGYDKDDIEAIKDLDYVKDVDYGFRFDTLVTNHDDDGVTVFTTDNFDGVNKPEVREGRLPEKDNECVIDKRLVDNDGYTLNEKITLKSDYGTKTYTVVGIISDPRYLCDTERGTNSLGNGSNDGYVEMLTSGNEDIAVDSAIYDLRDDSKEVYIDLRITFNNLPSHNYFSTTYKNYVSEKKDDIESLIQSNNKDLYKEIKAKALDKIADGEKDYNEGLQEYKDGKKSYEDGLEKYNDGLKQYNDGLNTYNTNLAKYNKNAATAKKTIKDGYSQIAAGEKQLDTSKAALDEKKKELDASKVQLDAAEETINTNKAALASKKKELQASKTQLTAAISQIDASIAATDDETTLASLKASRQSYSDSLDQVNAGLAEIESSESTLEESQKELDANKETYNSALTQINAGYATINEKQKELDKAKAKLKESEAKLALAKTQLDEAKKTLDSSKKQLDESKVKLDDAKEELDKAKKELSKAKTKIKNAKKDVEELEEASIVSLTTKENAGIISFDSNSDAMNSISVIFPLIFFLVAALVSLTTMTRMVEEQRVQCGTFRALGYSKKDIIMQYLVYAFLATFFACGVGYVFGSYFFPWVIYYLYSSLMFDVGAPTVFVFKLSVILQAYIISVAVTMLVTYSVCHSALNEQPASLLRPKAPKSGKRILLERMTPIWSRMSFNQKVTMRNIFRYKKRFFMSVIGIAGCTALMITGFGIKYSIGELVDLQYNHVLNYNCLVNYEDTISKEEALENEAYIKKHSDAENVVSIYNKTTDVKTEDSKAYTGVIEIPSSSEEFNKVVDLHTSKGKELALNDDGVYISCKLAKLLKVSAGDTIIVTIEDHDYKVKVAGVFVIYFTHYIMMSEDFYTSLTGDDVKYTATQVKLDDSKNHYSKVFEDDISGMENVGSVSDISVFAATFDTMMNSLNSVVLILIVCAGLLAFVVLYNLTNINIQERKSEIATIKVLGFYPKEVYDYVFRENIFLALIGSLLGMVFGKYLHLYLISNVEIEMANFLKHAGFKSYLYAFLLTMVFTYLIDFIMRKVLKKIDMVESLKSIE